VKKSKVGIKVGTILVNKHTEELFKVIEVEPLSDKNFFDFFTVQSLEARVEPHTYSFNAIQRFEIAGEA